jgi:hypothetical protein
VHVDKADLGSIAQNVQRRGKQPVVDLTRVDGRRLAKALLPVALGVSAANRTSAPLFKRLMVFFLELSKAERTPRTRARSKIVGARTSFASSMYSSVPLF